MMTLYTWAIGNSAWKRKPGQKWKTEMENENGQQLMQMSARVKPWINHHLLKTISVQKPLLCKDHIIIMSLR